MSHSFLKISIISFLSINSLSFAMETTETFDIQKFSEDIRRHIFVVAHPSIQNQLKKCCRSWHAIGAKKAPNMYQLVNDVSFNPHQDDWRYIMMHAALDEDVTVMRNILRRTDQRNFDYDFGKDYFGNHYNERKVLLIYGKKRKELNKAWEVHHNNDLFKACFMGYVSILSILKVASECRIAEHCYSMEQLYDCIVMAVYNDNPYCIEILSLFPKVKSMIHDQAHVDLLRLAMRNNKKRAFRALVENNVYTRLNDPLCMHMGYNTTILDELNEQKDIPNLDDYITLYKELGGKSWQEIKDEEEETENSLFSLCAFVSTFYGVQ